MGFNPSMSRNAERRIRDEIRTWKVHRQTADTLSNLSEQYKLKVRGWYQYYGRYGAQKLNGILRQFQNAVILWAQRKHKLLRGSKGRVYQWLRQQKEKESWIFRPWQLAR